MPASPGWQANGCQKWRQSGRAKWAADGKWRSRRQEGRTRKTSNIQHSTSNVEQPSDISVSSAWTFDVQCSMFHFSITERQAHRNGGGFRRHGFNFDAPVMRGNNPLHDAQAEAAAVHRRAVRRITAKKTVENTR